MLKTISYKIIESDNRIDIEYLVCAAIRCGWTCQGNICVSGGIYYQSMVFME